MDISRMGGTTLKLSSLRTVATIADSLRTRETLPRLPAPTYKLSTAHNNIALAVESMRRHTTDEGWQIMQGLEHVGYLLCGHALPINTTNVGDIVRYANPNTCVIQDKREWDVSSRDFREPLARFTNVEALRERDDVFKVTILKDAHQRPGYHRQSAEEMGVHAWIVYYAPEIVHALAPYVRPEHLIRTTHSLDPVLVPSYSSEGRGGTLLSGAVSGVYPLRTSLAQGLRHLPETTYLKHPGYHRNGCATPEYLQRLSHYKVAICTSSVYGYALRKLIEATACGCIVVTDLPDDEILPYVNDNLVRIPPGASPQAVGELLAELYNCYNPDRQQYLANLTKTYYDYRSVGGRLAYQIEYLRRHYATAS